MRSHRLPVAYAVFASSLFVTGAAFAQDPAAAPAAPATDPATAPTTQPAPAVAPIAGTPTAEQDKPKKADDEEDDFKHVTLTANPLSLILTRIGVNVEYLPVTHHAFVLNPYFQTNSVEVGAGNASSETTYTTFGGELGYRFYTGNRGANGFFVGPSVFAQNTSSKVTTTSGGSTANAEGSTLVYGAILDLGGQHVTKSGFTIGGGIGVMYLVAANEPTATSSTVKFSGVLPRFLLTAGYSF